MLTSAEKSLPFLLCHYELSQLPRVGLQLYFNPVICFDKECVSNCRTADLTILDEYYLARLHGIWLNIKATSLTPITVHREIRISTPRLRIYS